MSKIKQAVNFCKYLTKYGINLCRYPFMPNSAIFADIYRKKIWDHAGSVSGDGSTAESTEILRTELAALLIKYKIQSLLDIPCGDFSWMSKLNLDKIDYTGADIVQEIIDDNNTKQIDDKSAKKRFVKYDICSDPLPDCDLIFCRDCLVHLSNKHIFNALDNIRQSGAKYLLMTTFPEQKRNFNMITGAWRAVNFEKPPFNFSPPLEIINEGFSLRAGRFPDKSMGLWEIASNASAQWGLGYST